MWSGCVRCGNAGRQGVLQHLPNTIQLGAFRGSVFYPGQSKECRKCGSLDHLAAACTMDICRNCKASDHTTAQCPTPVKCNFCSSANHSFKDCPQAHSNRVKLGLNDPVKCSSALTFLHSEGNDLFLLECNLSFRENYKVFEDKWRHGLSVWSGDNKNRSSRVAV
uniref:CCHC-type domain-containing protein n=1 Tax=Sparus aurata TaxID=8175 RepID=A0A671WGW1_SPAAU